MTKEDLLEYGKYVSGQIGGYVVNEPESVSEFTAYPLRVLNNLNINDRNSLIHPSTVRTFLTRTRLIADVKWEFTKGIKYEYLGTAPIHNQKQEKLHYTTIASVNRITTGSFPGMVYYNDVNDFFSPINGIDTFAISYYEYDLSYFYNKIETTDTEVTISLIEVSYTLPFNPLDNWNERQTQLPSIKVLQVTTLTPIK
jgi:hypothetical protein